MREARRKLFASGRNAVVLGFNTYIYIYGYIYIYIHMSAMLNADSG